MSNNFITEFFDKYDGKSLEAYQQLGGFKALEKTLAEGYEKAVEEIAKSGLQGRGGAAYPTGKKLSQAREAKGERKFVICNADEGEPGTFKDRDLLNKNIYQVIEGIIIAGVCADASEGYIYCREEYHFMHSDIREAIQNCYDKGLLGENIKGSGIDFDLKLFSGAGAYVCGEGFAMCESMEGKSGRPRTKPPYVKQSGLLNFPTLVINVETLSAAVNILRKGADEFTALGTEKSPGTKVISISGKVNNPGVYEVPFGFTVRQIVEEIGGGIKAGKKGNFVQIGGASGGILPESQWDASYSYEGLAEKGVSVGSGAIVVADEENDIMEYLQVVQQFFSHESCGKCTPCREGNRQLKVIMNKLTTGEFGASDVEKFDAIIRVMKDASLCGSGKTEIVPFETARKYFNEAFEGKEGK